MMARLMGLGTISVATLQTAIAEDTVKVFDVNAQQSWVQARVPGAHHLDPTAFGIADLPADRSRALVFYCSNMFCRKAPLAARRAKALGYANVQVLSAGISGWISAGLPVERGQS
jgi:rhodanese-related sulfurtransferase